MIKEYGVALKEKNQEFEFWEHLNRNHAYLDSGKLVDLENASEDLVIAARHALIQMIDYLVKFVKDY